MPSTSAPRDEPRPPASKASSVFRDALGVGEGSERKIALTDTTYEKAATVRAFLQLILDGNITIDKALPGIQRLVSFLDKWGCERHLANLMALVELAVRRGDAHPLRAFVVAASGQMRELCVLLIDLNKKTKWPDEKYYEIRGVRDEYGEASRSIWDLPVGQHVFSSADHLSTICSRSRARTVNKRSVSGL